MGLQQYAQYQCLGHGAATGRLKLMLLYITVYHLIFHAVFLLNNVFLIKPILYIYVYIYIYLYIWSIPTKVMHIGKKTTLLHSPELFSLYRRHMELSQKIYASS